MACLKGKREKGGVGYFNEWERIDDWELANW